MVLTPGVASARSSPFSFMTMPIISGRLVAPASCRLPSARRREALSLAITSSLSAICLTCFGETKLTASMCLNPESTNSFRYSALYSVGIRSGSPCQASRGHSISFTLAMEPQRKDKEVDSRQLKVEKGRRSPLGCCSSRRLHLSPKRMEHARQFGDFRKRLSCHNRRHIAQIPADHDEILCFGQRCLRNID